MEAGTDALGDWEDEHGIDSADEMPSDDEDDPDAMDPIAEGDGVDPANDDGDPSEPATIDSPWDIEDSAEAADQQRRSAEVIFVDLGNELTCIVQRATAPRSKYRRERGDLLEALGNALAKKQERYLRSENPDDLESLTPAELAKLAPQDKSTTGRLLNETWVEYPSGTIARLSSLLLDPDEARTRFITRLLQEREGAGRDASGAIAREDMLSIDVITHEVQERFGKAGNSESSVRRIMAEAGIPGDPDERQHAYQEGRDTWIWS